MGCASIISGRRADIQFETYPADAHVAIHDDRGRQVASLLTPGAVALKRQGRFFLPARYTATISAPGYQTAQVPIGSTLNPWLLGNIIIGGIPGIVIDSATGAAWKPKRTEIHQHLAPLNGPEPLPMVSDAGDPHASRIDPVAYTADADEPNDPSQSVRR